MTIGLIGKKLGMTREFFDSGISIPVTVVSVEKGRILDVITKEKRGYDAIRVGFGKIKNSKLTKQMKGVFSKKSTEPKKILKEFRVKNISEFKEGNEIGLELFKDEKFVDVTGKTIGTFFREEIGDRNDIDFFIGLPEAEEFRVAELESFEKILDNQNKNADKKIELTVAQEALKESVNTIDHHNSREWRQAEIPAANGQGSAAGLAKLYSLVTPEDLSLRILDERIIKEMTETQVEGKDLVLRVSLRWGNGFVLNKHKFVYGPVEKAFGHSGYGGSCAFSDPENKLGISYVMNKMENNFAGDVRSIQLINAAYECM